MNLSTNEELIGEILNSGTYSLLNQELIGLNQELIDQILNSGTYSLLNQELIGLNQELIGQILNSGQQIMNYLAYWLGTRTSDPKFDKNISLVWMTRDPSRRVQEGPGGS